MKTKLIFITLSVILSMSLASCSSEKSDKQFEIREDGATFQVIQFHSEHRCYTCNKIEEFTLATLHDYPEITFELVNIDERDNEPMADFFEAAGTALFLYNSETRQKLDLTDFAFMNAEDEAKFKAKLKKEIEQFFN